MADRICLVTAPVSTDYEDPEEALSQYVRAVALAPKLGVLALASVLEQGGAYPEVFDLDNAYADYLTSGGRGLESFPGWAAQKILASGTRLFGFSSICSSYPLTVRIAERLKALAPDCSILFGGPQASVTDVATLSAFPFIDFVLRGEADFSLPVFLNEWSTKRRYLEVPGLTWRSPFGPQRNPAAPIIDNLDRLPLPAFHLSVGLKDARYAFLELGRGCPFACTFCSTNDFFRRKFRVKSPARILADMRSIRSTYGFCGFNLVHDMFTVDRRKVIAFCHALIKADEDFEWSCSARTDCVDAELLELMVRSGCNGIFFGVETGSKRMQRIIGKDLDPQEARIAIETADRLGMETTVSTIIGFPEETEDDLRQTVDTFMHSMRHPRSLPKINILAPLSGTPIYFQHKENLVLEEVSSRLSYPGRTLSKSDRQLIQNYPAIFPNFYQVPTPYLDRGLLNEISECLPSVHARLQWLFVALYRRCPDVLGFLRAWRQHRISLHPGMHGSSLRKYYFSDLSRRELVAFIREWTAGSRDRALDALLKYEERLGQAIANSPMPPASAQVARRLFPSAIPVTSPGVYVIESEVDLQDVVNSLQMQTRLAATTGSKYYRTDQGQLDGVRLVEIAPLVAQSLLLCDGKRSVAEFELAAAHLFDCPREFCAFAARDLLKQLCRKRLIGVYAPTLSKEGHVIPPPHRTFKAGMALGAS